MYKQVLNRIYTGESGGQNKNFKLSLKCVKILFKLKFKQGLRILEIPLPKFSQILNRNQIFKGVMHTFRARCYLVLIKL